MGLFITMLLVAVTVGYYLTRVALPPRLIYQDNEANRQSVASIPALTQRYSPTPWLANTHLQLIFLGLKKAFGRRLQYDSHDILTMADGGTTALYWLGESLPEQTPTLLVLHTITGSPHSMRGLVRDLQLRTGWRVVVCTRRGHAELPLTAPRINTLGDTADLREQLAVITQRYPHSPLYAVGISAGSGLLVRYLGEEGHNTPIQGAMAYCPGYNVEVAFLRSRPPLQPHDGPQARSHLCYALRRPVFHQARLSAVRTSKRLAEFSRAYSCSGRLPQPERVPGGLQPGGCNEEHRHSDADSERRR